MVNQGFEKYDNNRKNAPFLRLALFNQTSSESAQCKQGKRRFEMKELKVSLLKILKKVLNSNSFKSHRHQCLKPSFVHKQGLSEVF